MSVSAPDAEVCFKIKAVENLADWLEGGNRILLSGMRILQTARVFKLVVGRDARREQVGGVGITR